MDRMGLQEMGLLSLPAWGQLVMYAARGTTCGCLAWLSTVLRKTLIRSLTKMLTHPCVGDGQTAISRAMAVGTLGGSIFGSGVVG